MKIVLAIGLVLAAAACAGTRSETTLTVFEVHGGILRPRVVHLAGSRPTADAILEALGAKARVTVADGTASVAVTRATDARIASIVYSLTQLPSVRYVDVAGRHRLTRDDFASYVPPILVETPAPGAVVPRTFRVAGTASVFEATLVVELVRDGTVLSRRPVTALEGAPGRGPFATTVHASPGTLTVRAFAPSAADGSPQHEVDVAITVRR